MNRMIVIKNVVVVSPPAYFGRQKRIVVVEDGKITGIHERLEIPDTADQIVDGRGMYLTPGFIDIHVHGGAGHDTVEADPDSIAAMCRAHALMGTTSILPTVGASPMAVLLNAVDAVRSAQKRCTCSNILGIHLEGPFLSDEQRGAQKADEMMVPAHCDYRELLDRWNGIRIMGAAPEIPGGLELGRVLRKKNIMASIAHSNATFDQVAEAMAYGYSDVTHIYSGCSSLTRKNGFRIAGVVEAGLYFDGLTVQVIADLRHLPVSLLKLIYKCKGPDRISLVSDAGEFSVTDIKEGTLLRRRNGIEVLYEDGVIKLRDRQAFAGSASTASQLVRNMHLDVGVPLQDAVQMASLTPAKCIGVSHRKGMIADGYDADLVLLDERIRVRMVMTAGKIIRPVEDPDIDKHMLTREGVNSP